MTPKRVDLDYRGSRLDALTITTPAGTRNRIDSRTANGGLDAFGEGAFLRYGEVKPGKHFERCVPVVVERPDGRVVHPGWVWRTRWRKDHPKDLGPGAENFEAKSGADLLFRLLGTDAALSQPSRMDFAIDYDCDEECYPLEIAAECGWPVTTKDKRQLDISGPPTGCTVYRLKAPGARSFVRVYRKDVHLREEAAVLIPPRMRVEMQLRPGAARVYWRHYVEHGETAMWDAALRELEQRFGFDTRLKGSGELLPLEQEPLTDAARTLAAMVAQYSTALSWMEEQAFPIDELLRAHEDLHTVTASALRDRRSRCGLFIRQLSGLSPREIIDLVAQVWRARGTGRAAAERSDRAKRAGGER